MKKKTFSFTFRQKHFVNLYQNISILFSLKVHFRSGIGGDARIGETSQEVLKDLDALQLIVKDRTGNLESTLNQLDIYQQQTQSLRQKIVQEEQQLRHVLSPTYMPHDREKAVADQQV